jgi:pyruvate/2-oxoglutarate dehydrogenase complex dihydrolipoamide acyltransferase (E2) component
MEIAFIVPKLGPEMERGLLTAWLVAEGDHVEEGQPIATLETDKIETDLEAPASGRITGLADVAEEYAIGDRLAGIATASAVSVAAATVAVAEAPSSRAAARAAMTERRRGEPLATPVARRIAQAHGIALTEVRVDGRIRKRHVEAVLRARENGGRAGDELTPMRRRIAQRVHASLQETAQITDVREHDVTAFVELRRSGLRWADALGFRVSLTDLLVRATALALREVPAVNASLTAENRLVAHGAVNIGIAVALDDGLVVPVLRDADRHGLAEIHQGVGALVGRARDGKSTREDLAGGTFTLTNIGSYGSHMATPILVQGQVGILATGAFLERPVVRDGALAVGTVMHTSLTVDHRVIDGRTAGQFQSAVSALLSDPDRLL